MEIKCSFKDVYPLNKIIPNPLNDNKHQAEHIDLLAKVISERGIRHPIIISARTGYIVAGHLRLLAAAKLGLKEFPVDIQDFKDDEDEYLFLSSDNNVARYAEFDDKKFIENIKMLEIDPVKFDFESAGLLDYNRESFDNFSLIEEVNNGDENSEWADCGDDAEFEKGADYITCSIHFSSLEDREYFTTVNSLPVKQKGKGPWLIYFERE